MTDYLQPFYPRIYTDKRQGPTIKLLWVDKDAYGRKVKDPILSVSIDGSDFVPINQINESAKAWLSNTSTPT